MTAPLSPLPWRRTSRYAPTIEYANGHICAMVPCDADLLFVLRAVNAHAALVEALKVMLADVEANRVTVGDCNEARAALKLAGAP